MRHDPWIVRTREVIGGWFLALALAGCGLNLAGCGLNVSSPDLFQLMRSGQGQPLTLVVNDSGTIRCNGHPPKPLRDATLLQARALVTNLANDAKAKLRVPPSARGVFFYVIRTQDGSISFPDTAALSHPELAQAEQFAVNAARDECGLAASRTSPFHSTVLWPGRGRRSRVA
jgi:hypothetical protein